MPWHSCIGLDPKRNIDVSSLNFSVHSSVCKGLHPLSTDTIDPETSQVVPWIFKFFTNSLPVFSGRARVNRSRQFSRDAQTRRRRPHSSLFPPVRHIPNPPQVPLADRITSGLDARQEQNCRLIVGGDLRQPGVKLDLHVDFISDRKNLPIVKLKRAA